MLKFKVIEELRSNTEILELLENNTYTIKKGQIRHLTNTNLKFVNVNLFLDKKGNFTIGHFIK